MRSVAVVGAQGFVGSALVQKLSSAGVDVLPFTRDRPCARAGEALAHEVCNADAVYWLATSTNPAIAESRPDLVAYDVHTLGHFLSALETEARGHLPRVVYASSGGAIYGTATAPFRETDEVQPVTAYGRAKATLEQLLADSPVPSLAIRFSNVYGPGQPAVAAQGVVAYWLNAVLRGERLTVFGDLRTTRDFVFIDDVVDGMMALGALPHLDAPAVNLGQGAPTSLGELVETLQDVTGLPSTRIDYLPGRAFDLRESWLDVGLAQDLIDWRPKYGLEDGIRQTWNHVLAAGEVRGPAC